MKQNIKNQHIIQNMINTIEEENTLKTFFGNNKIADINQIVDIQHYQQKDYHGGLILTIMEKDADKTTKILIDVRHGLTTINQVYDALYEIGKDCDIKIIVYSNGANGHDKFNPANDEYAVLSLIAWLQGDNVPVALYEIDRETSEMKYVNLYQDWHRVNRSKPSIIPTREQFMAETFWSVYFDSFCKGFYEPWNAYSGEFLKIGECGYTFNIDCSIPGDICLYWDQNGVRYMIQQYVDTYGILQNALDIDMPYLRDRYGADSIEIITKSGHLPSLKIKYSDKPFDWLYTATSEQIHAFAKSMYEDAWDLCLRIEKTIDASCEAQSA